MAEVEEQIQKTLDEIKLEQQENDRLTAYRDTMKETVDMKREQAQATKKRHRDEKTAVVQKTNMVGIYVEIVSWPFLFVKNLQQSKVERWSLLCPKQHQIWATINRQITGRPESIKDM